MRAFGANLVEHGEDFQSAREEAERHAERDGLELVPSFHPDLVLGVTTYALELFAKAPDLEVLYVPIGQGSGICGCILARDLLGLENGNRRRAVDGSAVLRAVVRGGHHCDDEQQQYARRRHGDARSRRGGACDHPQGRFAHRASHRRRSSFRDTRLLDRYPQPRRRRRSRRRSPRRCRRRQSSAENASG